MSSKVESRTVTHDGERELNPKLRFPVFRDGPAWSDRPFSDLYIFQPTNTFSREHLNYATGTVKNIHYGDIHTRFPPLLHVDKELVPFVNPTESLANIDPRSYCTEGDLIFADASEDLADVGKSIEIVALNNTPLLSGTHTLLARRKDTHLIVGFAGYLFRAARIRDQIKKEAQGSKVFGISAGRLSNVRVCYPPSKIEQRQISDCLSSLEEVIAAQTQKVDALTAHKKGLIQQLFPSAGKTLPRLRFPEFRKGRGWQMKRLGALLRETPRPIELRPDDDYSLVTVKRRYGGVVSRGILQGKAIKVKSQFLVEANDFLISKRQIVHNACGLVPKDLEGSVVSNEYSVLTPKAGCDIAFFNYFTQQPCVSDSFLQSSVGIVIEKMLFNLAFWLNREFLFPSLQEQRRIAACLASTESHIDAQTHKLEGLKLYQKGLMQQLFPLPDEGL